MTDNPPGTGPTTVSPGFHLLVKPTGSVCNLKCKYCFFLDKEKLYPGSKPRMPDRLLERYLKQLIEAHSVPEVTVAWQGGEPTLMGLDFFRRSIEYERKYARPGMKIINTIQTNGTLINDEWAAFFKEHDFLVGLSIDGPQALHDVYRVDKGGAPTFDRVMKGLGHLQKHGVPWNALTTINSANGGHPVEVYSFLRDDCRAEFIQFIPVVERPNRDGVPYGGRVTRRSLTPAQFGSFMTGIFDEWVKRDVGSVFVQWFDAALANWYGVPAGLCISNSTCGSAPAMEFNGDVYSCDHFVEPRYMLGNITGKSLAELVYSNRQSKFGRDKYDRLPDFCLQCDVLFACHGGCPKDRFTLTPDGQPGLNYLCTGYKAFFKHVDGPMKTMAGILGRGGEAPEIMTMHKGQ